MITNEMVEEAARRAWRSDDRASSWWGEVDPASKDMYRTEARAVLEYALSNFPGATLGPTSEDRLKDYRCAMAVAWAGQGATPELVEDRAHAMLAAERSADAPARNESADAAPVLRKALALALRSLLNPDDAELRRKTIEAIMPAASCESAGSLRDRVMAWLDMGHKSSADHIAHSLAANPVDVANMLSDLEFDGHAEKIVGTAIWRKVVP